jgi:methylmalonyl-CoA/ethylmalonyl-CoA epimerase
MVNGVNRVILAVKDLEAAKTYYKTLLGAEFYSADWTGEPFGIQVAISWNAGIELCAPIVGKEDACFLTPVLRERGETVLGVVFNVEDADMGLSRASSMGIGTVNSVDYSQAEIDAHLDGLFTRYKEYFLNTSSEIGYGLTLGQFESRLR